MSQCLICGQPCADAAGAYHTACSKALFSSGKPPVFGYSWDQLNQMAEQIVRSRVAVPGVQPKLSLHLEQTGRGTPGRLTLVGLQGGHILKPPTPDFPFLPESEHFCMTFARLARIETVDFGLIRIASGELAYLTRRMDRTPQGPLHLEDFCQLTDKLTEQKYRGSMEQVGKALRRFSSIPGFDALRLFELTLFCFLTGNSDMHLKNFSLLRRPDGSLRLAPAYDLVPVALLLPADTEELALTLNGRKARLTRADFQAFGHSLGLNDTQLRNAFRRLLSATSGTLAAALDRSFLPADQRGAFEQLFQARLQRIA
jgi:serine/threonine-protein kinase HipA